MGLGALSVTALQARADVREAIELANDGLDAAEDGNTEDAARLLNESARLFGQANSRLTAPWALPARVLPIIGNNANALVVATDQGRLLTRTAARSAAVIDLDDLSFVDGRLDLDAVAAIDQPIESARPRRPRPRSRPPPTRIHRGSSPPSIRV